MSLDYAILGFLSEEERSGYDLKTRCFDSEAQHFWTVDQAQVYRTLDRLERDELVDSRYEQQHGRPNRRVFEITKAGRRSLDDWLATPHEPPPSRDPLLAQLRFGATISDEVLADLLERQRSTRQEQLENLRGRLTEKLHQKKRPARREELALMTLEAKLVNERATIDWLDDCIERLRHREAGG